jgi:uncharacterized protein YheU (UPF0270 family)
VEDTNASSNVVANSIVFSNEINNLEVKLSKKETKNIKRAQEKRENELFDRITAERLKRATTAKYKDKLKSIEETVARKRKVKEALIAEQLKREREDKLLSRRPPTGYNRFISDKFKEYKEEMKRDSQRQLLALLVKREGTNDADEMAVIDLDIAKLKAAKMNVKELMVVFHKMWETLDTKQKEKYNLEANAAAQEYNRKKKGHEAYRAARKKPLTPFLRFVMKEREGLVERLQRQEPGKNFSVTDIARRLGEMYKMVSQEEKTRLHDEYKLELDIWNQKFGKKDKVNREKKENVTSEAEIDQDEIDLDNVEDVAVKETDTTHLLVPKHRQVQVMKRVNNTL